MKTKSPKLKPRQKLEILTDIASKNEGTITPEILVAEASKKSHPLHSHFEWDNSKAANQYRLQQAALLIRSVKIHVEVKDSKSEWCRAFVNVRDEASEIEEEEARHDTEVDQEEGVAVENRTSRKGFYVSLNEALAHPLYKDQLIDSALKDLQSFKQKYKTLSQLSGLFRHIDDFLMENQT